MNTDTLELFDAVEAGPTEPNPCRRLYGPGPDGATCGGCSLLASLGTEGYKEKRYSKCTLRKITHGAGSDHRKSWRACGRYTEAEIICSRCGATKAEAVVQYSEVDSKPYCRRCYQAGKAKGAIR